MAKQTKEYSDKNEIAEIVRQNESDYISGKTTISKYVQHSLYDTVNTIEAYLNSKHISGDRDSQGRLKPFPNIVVSASNIWYRATDIDRKNIRIKAGKSKDTLNSLVATVLARDWMTRNSYGQFLNNWGRVLSRYGSAVVKHVEKDGKLIPSVIPWNRLIVDSVSFEGNPVIEVLEYTEAQLRKQKSYNQDVIEELTEAKRSRENLDKTRKDTKNDYIKVYEIHGEFPLSYLTGKEKDEETYVQQMHVVSFLANKKAGEYQDFCLYSGREEKNPYDITHLIEEDGRTLSIGAVEHLFQAQWMMCHTAKSIKDQLDIAGKLIFQTSDGTFVGQNAITAIENGDILIHAVNQPLTQLANNSHDISSLQSFGQQWKALGNEIIGVSEAMLGVAPKSGTAWRQTEALLQESYSLFELMTENKGLYIEKFFRERIIPFIKKTSLKTSKEISGILEAHEIYSIDSKYIKNYSIKESNRIIKDKVLNGEEVTQEEQQSLIASLQQGTQSALSEHGVTRFFKPNEIDDVTWKEQFADMEWELEIDITGEAKDYQSALATLNTALQVVVQPGFEQNPRARMIVDKILETSGYISPIELSQIKSMPSPMPAMQGGQSSGGAVPVSGAVPSAVAGTTQL